jgi:hypothetical protein
MTTIKADPGYYVFSLKEIECGQIVLAKHPVIAFEIVPYRTSERYETRPITAADHNGYDNHFDHDHKQTLLTPQGLVYDGDGSPPVSLHVYLECMREQHGEKLYVHVSVYNLNK